MIFVCLPNWFRLNSILNRGKSAGEVIEWCIRKNMVDTILFPLWQNIIQKRSDGKSTLRNLMRGRLVIN